MTTASLVGHLLLGLTVVFGVMAVIAKLVRRGRSGGLRGRRAPAIEAVARLSLSKASSVAVLRVGQRELLVGVSAGTVSVLAETDLGVLTGSAAMTIDMRGAEPAQPVLAMAGAAATPELSTALSTALSPALSVRPTARLGTDVPAGAAWWPTFVELLRQRTARTATNRPTTRITRP
jgi:flagellar biogenesis protein FliO